MSDKDPRSDARMVFLAATNPGMLLSGRRKMSHGMMALIVLVALGVAIWVAVASSAGSSHPRMITCYPGVTSRQLAAEGFTPSEGGRAGPYQASSSVGCDLGDSTSP